MSGWLEYRGYQGSIHFSVEDGVFHGRLEHIRDLATYEGDDVPSVEEAFRAAVEDYVGTSSE